MIGYLKKQLELPFSINQSGHEPSHHRLGMGGGDKRPLADK